MKKFFLVASLFVALLAVGCGSDMASETGEVPTVDTTTYAYTAPYVCPMRCEGSGSDKMGVCPECGMDYEANPNAKTDAKTDSVAPVADSAAHPAGHTH